jgi:hypothetical protein
VSLAYTGAEKVDKCGCAWREFLYPAYREDWPLVPEDGNLEGFETAASWMCESLCVKHEEQFTERTKVLMVTIRADSADGRIGAGG